MKKTITLFILFLCVFALKAKNPKELKLKSQSLFHFNYLPFFEDWYRYPEGQHTFTFSYEYRFLHKKLPKFYSSFEIGTGIIINKKSKNRLAPTLDYSFGYNHKNHFFEVGAGLVLIHTLIHANIGYGILINKNVMLRASIKPASYIFYNFYEGTEYAYNFTYINFSIGYQLSSKKAEVLKGNFNNFVRRFSVQLSVRPIGYTGDYEYKLVKTMGLDFLIFKKEGHQIQTTLRVGRYLGFIIKQIGFSYIYGKRKHFLEMNINLLFANLLNPSFEFEYDDYRLFQPQLGYRYQCQKLPIFARIAYAPYVRTLDWKREGGLHHNMVLGVGCRFRK